MANKIKKMINNGVSYTVGGVESSNDTYENIIHLTQEEYDALETKDPDTLYSTPDSSADPALSIIGEIKIFSGTTIPDKFLECDGSALSTDAYPELFAVIGYTYGGSEGTFNLPNLKGKVVVGYNSSDSCFNCIGKYGGEKAHQLSVYEMPTHSHCFAYSMNDTSDAKSNSFVNGDCRYGPGGMCFKGYQTSTTTGCGYSHNNLQPYMTMKYIIRCK